MKNINNSKFKNFTNKEKNEDKLNYNLEDNENENEKVDESRTALGKRFEVKNLRQIGYGAAGLTIGLIAYLLLSAGAPTANEARSMVSEFTTANHDSGFGYEDVVVDEEYTGDVVPLHPFGSYRVTLSEFDEYERNETVRYGKVNPTFFFDMPAATPEDNEGEPGQPGGITSETTLVDVESTDESYESYEEVLTEYSKRLKSKTPTLIKEYENESSNNNEGVMGLADIYLDKVGELASIYIDGLGEMAEILMYKGNGSNDEYYSWADKLNKIYFEEAEKISDVYFSDGGERNNVIEELIEDDSNTNIESATFNTGGRRAKVIDGFNIHTTKTEKFNVEDIREKFAKHAVLPLDAEHFNITSTYGARRDPFTGVRAFHAGVDFSSAGISGSNIYSVLDGEVVESVTNFGKDGLGNYVVIDHGDFHTLYAHMKDGPTLEVGDVVQAGDVVGTVGSTGRSTGPHLHFEVGVGGVKFDGLEFLIHAVDKANSGM